MKIEKRKPKFKLGQLVIASDYGDIGFIDCVIAKKQKRLKYIVADIDGRANSKKRISEKKLLNLNPEIKKECPISAIDDHKESRYVDAMESMGFIPCAAERFRKQVKDASAEKPKEPENVAVNDPFDSACTAFIKMSKKFKKNTKGFRVGDLVEIISTGVRMFVSDTTFYSDTEDLFVNLSPSPRASSVIDRIESHKLRLIKRNED